MSYKDMRVIVLFDLPTTTRKERGDATRFRSDLIDDGFDMLQYSVYSRLCANRDIADKHMQRIKCVSPEVGSVRMLYVTENQFTGMQVLAGAKTKQEQKVNSAQMTFF